MTRPAANSPITRLRQRLQDNSLHVSVLIGLFAAMVISGVIGMVLEFRTATADAQSRLQVDLQRTSDVLAASLVSPLWELSVPGAEAIVRATADDTRIVSIVVTDSHRNKTFVEVQRIAGQLQGAQSASRQIMRAGEEIGTLTVTMTIAPYLDIAKTRSMTTLYQGLAVLSTALLTILFILRFQLLKPIRQLTQEARRIAAQDLTTPVTAGSRNEIGQVFNALEYMRSQLLTSFDELRKSEADLIAHHQHLENIVRVRTAELDIARQSAETANIAKSAFLANMSHEIRTPLNAITGMAHILRRSGLTSEQSDRLDKIENAGSHLLRVINDVLDLSKIEAGKFALEDAPVHVEALLGNVASMLGQKAQDKGLRFNTETNYLPHNLHGDPTRLQQALLNYVANAIKFTEIGHITLRVMEVAQTDETATLRFEVEDSGIGIAPEALNKLFSAFEQADNSTTRKYGGTGLGLAITKKIAEVMGGTAGATSSQGKGSTFWFTAVLRRGPQTEAVSAIAGNKSAEQIIQREHAGKRILLAEDEPINREIALMLLEDVGLVVDLAEDGREALEKARSGRFAVILMDMQMPVLDGLDATRHIRQLPDHRRTPILAMTANAFAEDKDRCFDAGMDDFLTKPAKPEILYATLLKWFEQHRG